MEVGVLDIQGDVSEHTSILEDIGVRVKRIRRVADLETISGIVIPGGESTVIGSIMLQRGISKSILERNIPVMGTCAGLILISKSVEGKPGALPLLDISIKRNGYGSQRESFETDLTIKGVGKFRGVFIRAPKIIRVKSGEVLSSYDGEAVMVSGGKHLGLTFHPEIYGDPRIHKLFLDGL
ncbi:MAG: pyridoxal 5'-phosphate synthase glutaminase subunit PdxT [Candidatus Thermoplasmatota archaeon]|jgi:5'-phosphate synthase pdxT subunit|nr:pyridoxal 5'-phosphate synthase glutaminase subunit PdxT [Candidatus Thermoplasmatota archaeon]